MHELNRDGALAHARRDPLDRSAANVACREHTRHAGLEQPRLTRQRPPLDAATTLVAGSERGEAHGQLYLVDLDALRGARVLSWTRPGIAWEGVTGARGLRGIACTGEEVLIAASGELVAFAPDLVLRAAYPCAHLGDAQQLAIFRRTLYVVSAAHDSILGFDLDARRFDWGLHLVSESGSWRGVPFEPGSTLGPSPNRQLELNSIHCDARGLFIAGARTHGLLHFDGRRIKRLVTLPEGARDARPWRDGVQFTDTEAGCARFMTPRHNHAFRVPQSAGPGTASAAAAGSSPVRTGMPAERTT